MQFDRAKVSRRSSPPPRLSASIRPRSAASFFVVEHEHSDDDEFDPYESDNGNRYRYRHNDEAGTRQGSSRSNLRTSGGTGHIELIERRPGELAFVQRRN